MKQVRSQTIALESARLEAAIEVLSDAATGFALTTRERLGYAALMLSVDLATIALAVVAILFVIVSVGVESELSNLDTPQIVALVTGLVAFAGSVVSGVVALALNLPLFRRLLREHGKLKALGVKALNRLLWTAGRRTRTLGRLRCAVVVACAALLVLVAVLHMSSQGFAYFEALIAGACLLATLTFFAARHLQNQREQMDLAANAVALKSALKTMRAQAGAAKSIPVSAEVLQQATRIESALIASHRTEAILSATDSRSTGYAIKFTHDAAERRAALSVSDRLELEDLLESMSISGPIAPKQGVALPTAEETCRAVTIGKRVQIEYAVDEPLRQIRILAVRGLQRGQDEYLSTGNIDD